MLIYYNDAVDHLWCCTATGSIATVNKILPTPFYREYKHVKNIFHLFGLKTHAFQKLLEMFPMPFSLLLTAFSLSRFIPSLEIGDMQR